MHADLLLMQLSVDHATVAHINRLSSFLAVAHDEPLPESGRIAYVLIGSAILTTLESVYNHLSVPTVDAAVNSAADITLVLSGGIGHSTQLLRDAVGRHPTYSHLLDAIVDLPEARIFELLLHRYWPKLQSRIDRGDIRLLVEDQSTNCGANAQESIRCLDQAGCHEIDTLVVIQDPTMMRRTVASFEKAYHEGLGARHIPNLLAWPTFVPRLAVSDGIASWDMRAADGRRLDGLEVWTQERFLDLLLGEIPRLRDDAEGYGPKGRGYIAHVDIPTEIGASWTMLSNRYGRSR